MDNFKSILVVIDPTRVDQPALSRAAELASKTGADVNVFLSIYDFSYEMTTMLSSEEREAMRRGVVGQRREWVEQLVEPFGRKGLNLTVKVVWHNRPFEATIKEAISGRHDLIVKATQKHDKLKSVIFTPTDWHLLRKSPVPVLLVKEHDWPANGHILAAINAGNEDEAHVSLNHKVANQATHLASLVKANVHFVNSFPGTPVNIAIEIPEFDPQAYNEAVRDHHIEELAKIAEKFGVPEGQCHVAEGLPEDVIPRISKETDAELVIIGTVGRTGLSAALIGNTAEHVIDRLDCDVLAIKPEGFESPITPDE